MRTFVLLISISAFAFGCKPATEPTEPAEPADTAASTDEAVSPQEVQQVFDQLRQTWIESADQNDAAAIAALYSSDAILTRPQEEPVIGRPNIEDFLQIQLPMISDLRIDPSRVEADRNLAAEYGTFTQQLTPPEGGTQQLEGEYVVVSRLQDDGSWRIVIHSSFLRTPGGTPAATETR